jgi:guanylate kinase
VTGNLFIICAPSGAGKTTLVAELLKRDSAIKLSCSYTTRPARPGEMHGREYHFIAADEFKRMAAAGDFLESAHVHGNYYGTSQRWIEEERAAGSDLVLEIDWQGAAQVRKLIPGAVSIFILPPSLDALETRLNKRSQDAPDVIAQRVKAAREEIAHVGEFDYVIINDDFADALQDLLCIVRAQRLRTSIQLARHQNLVDRMK